jgi:transcriptional regulator with XRE-family HTH domain
MIRQRFDYPSCMAVESKRRQSHAGAEGGAASPVLGSIFRHARSRRGFTLREVESRTGIPNGHLSQIERGQIKRPDQRIVWKLSMLYDLNFGLLATWIGDEEITDERAAYLDATVRFLRDFDTERLHEAMVFVERLAETSERARVRPEARRPRLGTGRSTDGARARDLTAGPAAHPPR